jgi:hypothetical protein
MRSMQRVIGRFFKILLMSGCDVISDTELPVPELVESDTFPQVALAVLDYLQSSRCNDDL